MALESFFSVQINLHETEMCIKYCVLTRSEWVLCNVCDHWDSKSQDNMTYHKTQFKCTTLVFQKGKFTKISVKMRQV